MTLRKFQTEAARFRGNPDILIDEDNKTIWRVLCRIPVRTNENSAVCDRRMLVGNAGAPAPTKVA